MLLLSEIFFFPFLSPLVLDDFDTINYLFWYISDVVSFSGFNILYVLLVIVCWWRHFFQNMLQCLNDVLFLFQLFTLVSSVFNNWLMFWFCSLEKVFLCSTFTAFNVMPKGKCFCVKLFLSITHTAVFPSSYSICVVFFVSII